MDNEDKAEAQEARERDQWDWEQVESELMDAQWGYVGINKFIAHHERRAIGWHGGCGCSSSSGTVRSLNFLVERTNRQHR